MRRGGLAPPRGIGSRRPEVQASGALAVPPRSLQCSAQLPNHPPRRGVAPRFPASVCGAGTDTAGSRARSPDRDVRGAPDRARAHCTHVHPHARSRAPGRAESATAWATRRAVLECHRLRVQVRRICEELPRCQNVAGVAEKWLESERCVRVPNAPCWMKQIKH